MSNIPAELRLRDGHSELNYAIYHDRYQRTSDGWKFALSGCA